MDSHVYYQPSNREANIDVEEGVIWSLEEAICGNIDRTTIQNAVTSLFG